MLIYVHVHVVQCKSVQVARDLFCLGLIDLRTK